MERGEGRPFGVDDARRGVGRRLCTDREAAERGFADPISATRRRILRETLDAFEQADPPDHYPRLAAENLERWRRESLPQSRSPRIFVWPHDWGVATHALTRQYGKCFAVLNMANAYVPGGGYVEGAPAQEENLFRRSDCHFAIDASDFDPESERYHPDMTNRLTGSEGVVYLDAETPRVCIRGPEDRSRADLGYAWLPNEEIFPFFELRAAAQDLRDGSPFDPREARRRIAAQLDTLVAARLRHAVLSAFGCGAFKNPAAPVARIYHEEIAARASAFDVIAFAIFAPGYGPDNLNPFADEFGDDAR